MVANNGISTLIVDYKGTINRQIIEIRVFKDKSISLNLFRKSQRQFFYIYSTLKVFSIIFFRILRTDLDLFFSFLLLLFGKKYKKYNIIYTKPKLKMIFF